MALIGIDARKLADLGVGSYIRNLVAELARLPGDERYTLWLRPGARLEPLGERFALETARAAGYSLAEQLELPWRARRARVALYHAPHYVLPTLVPAPAVVTIHDVIHLRFPEHLRGRGRALAARALLGQAVRKACAVLTVSEASRRDIVELLGVPEERIVVTPNGVEERFFRPPTGPELRAAALRLGLAELRFVLYVGGLKPHKNIERLIEALALVRRTPGCRDVVLALAGSGRSEPEARRLEARATELGLAHALRWLGRLEPDALPAVYRLASALAFPSLYEGFGLPVLEAMACGTPVVTSSVSSLPEVAGDAALLVDPLESGAIAEALVRLLEEPALAAALSARGRARARLFTWTACAGRTLALYRELLRR